MKVQVQLFARARDLAGSEWVEVDVPPPASVRELRAALERSIPALSVVRSALLIAVNNEYAADATLIAEEAEVAAFPPVSGG